MEALLWIRDKHFGYCLVTFVFAIMVLRNFDEGLKAAGNVHIKEEQIEDNTPLTQKIPENSSSSVNNDAEKNSSTGSKNNNLNNLEKTQNDSLLVVDQDREKRKITNENGSSSDNIVKIEPQIAAIHAWISKLPNSEPILPVVENTTTDNPDRGILEENKEISGPSNPKKAKKSFVDCLLEGEELEDYYVSEEILIKKRELQNLLELFDQKALDAQNAYEEFIKELEKHPDYCSTVEPPKFDKDVIYTLVGLNNEISTKRCK
ncbi:225_t:CDS:2 [Diversispora eburnea]|uniref:225_t:CDS:1 n=1 Tax=Diversispora eburnea TaxID=1213867 RepID=A0A9N9BQB7_9GLOM|nr:225_t:CDS:2 [Diversispora eburnea]